MTKLVRPKLSDVCSIVESTQWYYDKWHKCYLKLTESGGFEVLVNQVEGSVEVLGGINLRKAVRKALDLAEKKLHDRRREYSRVDTDVE